MEKLQGLKIKIRRGKQNIYPNFGLLQVVMTSGMKWSQYVDKYLGWHYDQTSDLRTESNGSPFGEWWGVVIMPVEFVNQAVSKFPDECIALSEIELADFYDNKAHIYDPDEKIILEVLEAIKAKDDLGLERTASQIKALDPNDTTPGITTNKMKTLALLKASRNINI